MEHTHQATCGCRALAALCQLRSPRVCQAHNPAMAQFRANSPSGSSLLGSCPSEQTGVPTSACCRHRYRHGTHCTSCGSAVGIPRRNVRAKTAAVCAPGRVPGRDLHHCRRTVVLVNRWRLPPAALSQAVQPAVSPKYSNSFGAMDGLSSGLALGGSRGPEVGE